MPVGGARAGTRRFGTRASRTALGALVAAVALLVSVLAPPAMSQNPPQGVGLAITPLFPPLVTVGDQDVPAQLVIANNSFGVGPVTLGQITLNPSCGDPSAFTCVLPDPGVFDLSATAVGVSGACAGVTFAITGPDPGGTYVFVPNTPVVLQPTGQPNSTCVIAFTFDVLKAPTIDAAAGVPGRQTRQFATVTGTAPAVVNGTPTTRVGTGTGTSIVTVALAEPTLTTFATRNATLPQPISDTATVTGPAGPLSPPGPSPSPSSGPTTRPAPGPRSSPARAGP